MEDPKTFDEAFIIEVQNFLFKITSPGKILKFIKRCNKNSIIVTSKLIQEKFGIGKSTVSQYLGALEYDYHLIEREKHGLNKTIKITEFGKFFIE